MTPEDWTKWDEHIEHLKETGEYLKPVTFNVSYMPWPDSVLAEGPAVQSYGFDVLDFSKNDDDEKI